MNGGGGGGGGHGSPLLGGGLGGGILRGFLGIVYLHTGGKRKDHAESKDN